MAVAKIHTGTTPLATCVYEEIGHTLDNWVARGSKNEKWCINDDAGKNSRSRRGCGLSRIGLCRCLVDFEAKSFGINADCTEWTTVIETDSVLTL